MKKIWFTSDHHFGHENIIKYCNRPFKDVESMNEAMILCWNERIKPCDLVYYLGDFGLTFQDKLRSIANRLNGEKVIILGNHDRKKKSLLEIGFSKVFQHLTLETQIGRIALHHRPPQFNIVDIDLWICGHVHNKWRFTEHQDTLVVNVGVDVWDFKPISLREILMKGISC